MGERTNSRSARAAITRKTMLPPPLLSLLRLRPPPKKSIRTPMSARSATTPTMVTASVDTRMSSFLMWLNSWASTASSSMRFIFSSRPVVTATAACLGLRPVANAFGATSSMM